LSSRIPAISQTTLVRSSLRRVSRIIVSTTSMYVLTHFVAFAMLPAGVALSYRDSAKLSRPKVRFAAILLRVVGKKVEVSGIEHVAGEHGHIIVTNYPSFYGEFRGQGVSGTPTKLLVSQGQAPCSEKLRDITRRWREVPVTSSQVAVAD